MLFGKETKRVFLLLLVFMLSVIVSHASIVVENKIITEATDLDTLYEDKVDKSPIHYIGYESKLRVEDGGNLYKFSTDYKILKYIFFAIVWLLLLPSLRKREFKTIFIIIFLAMVIYFSFSYINNRESSSFNLNLEVFNDKSIEVQPANFNKSKKIPFKDIYGFQILEGRAMETSSHGEHFDVYELNLVLMDMRRINIGSYYDYEQIRSDTERVARALNKSILDEVE